MSQTSRRPFKPVISFAVACACLVSAAVSTRVFAQVAPRSYQVLSESPSEVIIKIEPQYRYNTVIAADSKTYTEVRFTGGSNMDVAGAPEEQKLILPLLAPNRTHATVEVVDQKLDVRPDFDLAPIPTYVRHNDEYVPVFGMPSEPYHLPRIVAPYKLERTTVIRTAYVQRLIISPVMYDAVSRSLTLVRSMTLRVKFTGAIPKAVELSKSEAGFFQTVFVNGSTPEFYRAAISEIEPHSLIGKNPKALSASSGQWLMVETTDEGVYRISASDLKNMGITGNIDANSIELFGVGGAILDENITDQSGEWVECPIELHANGSDFQDLYFYAPGTTQWKYSREYLKADGIYHTKNPYTERGHYLLKIGGDRLASAARIQSGHDTIVGTPVSKNYVLTGITHEADLQFENQFNIGHELLGEKITRSDVGPLSFSMDPPGYLPDSTTIRVGYDASVINASGSVSLAVNGQQLSSLTAHTSIQNANQQDRDVFRNWDNATRVPASASYPLNIDLSFTSDGPTAWAKLDFVELIYRRSLNIGASSIPFFVVDTLNGNTQPLLYTFQQAAGGEVWDVTTPSVPVSLATASGDALSVTLMPRAFRMRNYIAFSRQSLKSPSLSRISAPTLRETVGTTGTEEIILTPSAFLAQANEFKHLREQGGDATEPISVAVVNIDSVYREFGFGSTDVTAIRDFMAYTFRHGKTKVHYLLLFGGGHCDYRNIVAKNVPNWMPPYEVDPFPGLVNYRTYPSSDPYPFPDDGYFGRDTIHVDDFGRVFDVAVGRVSANTVDEAEAFVAKTIHYEHGSDSGVWRSIATFNADDRIEDVAYPDCDPINHLGDSENEEAEVPKRIQIHKIYDVSYPRIQTAGGVTQPDVEQAIASAINDGTVLYSFIGHGNPNVWTHEGTLEVPSTINKFTNFDKLAYFTTATCDFSEFDHFADPHSGGVRLLLKPDGGAIGLLGTSRSVTGGDNLPTAFYDALLNVRPESGLGSGTAGDALIAGKLACGSSNLPIYYLLGDPAQRLLIPKRVVSFDTIEGATHDSGMYRLPALSQTRIIGHILQGDGKQLLLDNSFNGTVTVTLFDAPLQERASTTCPGTNRIVNDAYWVNGPILYRGTATVKEGRFSVSFVVPKDVRLDTMNAKISGYAYGTDGHTALGVETQLRLMPPPPDANVADTTGPSLALFIGSRNFRSGDAVSKHTTAIVDVSAIHGLNTSTASVGHSFVVWVDDAQDSSFDMAPTYISKQDDFTSGSSTRRVELPSGHHTLHARAFDAYNNPSFASVEFVAKNEDPYRLYEVTTHPNPVFDHTTFSFTQPGAAGSLVEITLSIFTTDSRLARTITLNTRESTVDIPWDGRDNVGNTVANGVYIFTINARNLDDGTSSMATGKCVVAR